MRASLAIGDFSRATHLTIKTLRHYHRIGLLVPAEVDPASGHRRYRTDQITTAQIVRRFRSLDMPLEDIRAVLDAPDLATRNELISSHLGRVEVVLARTQKVAASLRYLLEPPTGAAQVAIQHRQVAAVPAVAVCQVIDAKDALTWWQGALGELRAFLAARGLARAGPAGGIFANSFFTHKRGGATIYFPCAEPVRSAGRVTRLTVPPAELAVITHLGGHHDLDRAYGLLAAHVAEHALGIEGPIREFYLVASHDIPDETSWRTEIGWPIFHTGAGVERPEPKRHRSSTP